MLNPSCNSRFFSRSQGTGCWLGPVSEIPAWSSAITKVFGESWKRLSLLVLLLAALIPGLLIASANGQMVINYPNGFVGSSGQVWLENYASLSGSEIHLVPSVVHNGSNAWFKTPENIQAFTTTFTFHVDCSSQPSDCGDGLGFMIICACSGGNPTYNPSIGHPGYTYSGFSGGQFSWSQCEIPLAPASSYCFNNGTNGDTGSDLTQLPDAILVKFDLYNNVTGVPGGNFTGYYTDGEYPQAPQNPQYDMSGSGINMQSGDLFSATLSYDGTTLTETLTDTVTNATYTHSYAANIPAAITANVGFIGFGGGTGAATEDAYIHSWTYAVEAPGQPSATPAPTFSPLPGSYASAQSVTISDLASAATIYYTTDGTTPTTSSSEYVNPITVSSTEALQAIAVAPGENSSSVVSAAYTINSSSQPTNFAIGMTVQRTGVKHLGINIGGQDYYDSGQISRNLTVRNPGFEAEMWSSILNCEAATATTCTDSDANNTWPANFLQGATFQVIYGAANGQSGTIAGNTVSNPSGSVGITLTFSAPLSPAPAAGDVVEVRMQVPGNPQAGWWVTASGGATFSPDTTDLSLETPGKQALAINAAGSGQSANVASYFDSFAGRSFVQLNGTYTVTFRAKGVSGSNQINVSVSRNATPVHGTVTYLNQNVTLTNQWQDYSYTFNAAEDGTYIGTASLTFSIQGAQVYLDDVALTEPAAANNPTAFRNAVVYTLKALQPGVLRFMDGGADFASTTENMLAVPFARLRAGYGEGQTEAGRHFSRAA